MAARGPAPPVDLAAERQAGNCIRQLITEGLVTAVHDCSDGGLAVAIAEMALAGGYGAAIEHGFTPTLAAAVSFLFGEQQGRYVCTVPRHGFDAFRHVVEQLQMPWCNIGGTAARTRLEFGGGPRDSTHLGAVSLADLRRAHEGFFPALMGADAALP